MRQLFPHELLRGSALPRLRHGANQNQQQGCNHHRRSAGWSEFHRWFLLYKTSERHGLLLQTWRTFSLIWWVKFGPGKDADFSRIRSLKNRRRFTKKQKPFANKRKAFRGVEANLWRSF